MELFKKFLLTKYDIKIKWTTKLKGGMRMGKAGKLSRYIFTVIVMFISWIMLTSTFRKDELVAGFIVSLLVAIGSFEYLTEHGLGHFSPKRILYLLIYSPYYIWQILLANFDVAYRVVSPSMPIKPGFVIIKTNLKTDSGKLALANSITMTPGTLTIDAKNDEILIHWIYVKDETIEGATREVGTPFEKYLKEIFG